VEVRVENSSQSECHIFGTERHAEGVFECEQAVAVAGALKVGIQLVSDAGFDPVPADGSKSVT